MGSAWGSLWARIGDDPAVLEALQRMGAELQEHRGRLKLLLEGFCDHGDRAPHVPERTSGGLKSPWGPLAHITTSLPGWPSPSARRTRRAPVAVPSAPPGGHDIKGSIPWLGHGAPWRRDPPDVLSECLCRLLSLSVSLRMGTLSAYCE